MANPLDPNTPMQPEVTASVIRPDMTEAEIKKKLYELLGQSMGEQSLQIEALKAQARKEQALQEQAGTLGNLDLRPFAQAARGYGATNVAVPAEAPVDRTALLSKLQGAVSEAQQGLTKEQVNALKSMMEDKRTAQLEKSQENFDLRLRSTINSSEEAKKVRSIGVLNQKLTALEDLVKVSGPTLTGEQKAKLDSTFEDAKMAIKNSYELGALTGPDVGIIEGALGKSPTSLAGIGKYAISGGQKGLMSRISGARSRAVNEGKSHLESLKAVFPYEKAAGIYSDLNKKLEVPESEADKIRKELKALKGE
jgi:hypothetical protein